MNNFLSHPDKVFRNFGEILADNFDIMKEVYEKSAEILYHNGPMNPQELVNYDMEVLLALQEVMEE